MKLLNVNRSWAFTRVLKRRGLTTNVWSGAMAASQWYQQIPKVELHVHSDGACRLETLRELSLKYKCPYPHNDIEEFKKTVSLLEPKDSLVDFLSVFGAIGNILRTREAMTRIAYEFCEDMHRQNVLYAEYRFHPCNSDVLSGEDYCEGLFEGLERGEKDFNVKVRCILCFLRQRPESSATVMKLAERYTKETKWLVGVDIAGDELQPMDPQHVDGFKKARELGLHVTVHAAESGPPENVKEAIDKLGAERIGHGYRVLENSEIYRYARKKKVHFEVCPTSSIYTNSSKMDDHAVHRFVKDGVSFSLNTDDPGVMNCDLNGEYKIADERLRLTRHQIMQSVLDGAKATFLPKDEKKELVDNIKQRLKDMDSTFK